MTSQKMDTLVIHLRYFRNNAKAYNVLNRQTPPGTNASEQAMKERTRPMIDIRKFDTLGHADHGWLDARHHFSFASYHDPKRMGWGALRVWNDDAIAAQSGFPPPPHRDMALITYEIGRASCRERVGQYV